MPIKLDPHKAPHMIHMDSTGAHKAAFPTHTHGLNTLDLPEIFINASCFGPIQNANAINVAVATVANDDALIEKVRNKEEILIMELEAMSPEGEKESLELMLRPVSNTHLGVLSAYSEEDAKEGAFAQLYIKTDIDVLDEGYFAEAYAIATNPDLAPPCDPNCSCYKHEDGD
jgi:hypothetical protein